MQSISFTPQEQTLALHIANGLSVVNIAVVMNLPRTRVEAKVRELLAKANAKNTVHLVTILFRKGVIS